MAPDSVIESLHVHELTLHHNVKDTSMLSGMRKGYKKQTEKLFILTYGSRYLVQIRNLVTFVSPLIHSKSNSLFQYNGKVVADSE